MINIQVTNQQSNFMKSALSMFFKEKFYLFVKIIMQNKVFISIDDPSVTA
jgi:hypothetical protein